MKKKKAEVTKRPVRSVFSEKIVDYTRKDSDSDMRHERMTRTKKFFGITVYHKDYSYDCDDYEEKKKLGYAK